MNGPCGVYFDCHKVRVDVIDDFGMFLIAIAMPSFGSCDLLEEYTVYVQIFSRLVLLRP